MKRHYKVWTPEEAQRLSEAVKYVVRKYGAIQWDKVAGMVPERNIWQCKSFYASNIKKTKTEQINQLLKPYQNMPILVIPNEWASQQSNKIFSTILTYDTISKMKSPEDMHEQVQIPVNSTPSQETPSQGDFELLQQVKKLLTNNL